MKAMAELPYRSGFRFVGVRNDGTKIDCIVREELADAEYWIQVEGTLDESVSRKDLAGWVPHDPR